MHSTKPFLVLLLLLFLLFAATLPAIAAEEHFVITGDYKDSFELHTNDVHIFNVKDCVPGDSWESKIEVKNLSHQNMDIAIISIESLIEDLQLYNGLNLVIKHGEDILYQGIYGETTSPVTDYITVNAKDSIVFDVFVSFPNESSNQYQGKELNSLWTFEAKHPGYVFSGDVPVPEPEEEEITDEKEPVLPEQENDNDEIIPGTVVKPPVEPEPDDDQGGIKTGVELLKSNSLSITALLLAIFAFLLGLLCIVQIRR
jgi:hypothetical protein